VTASRRALWEQGARPSHLALDCSLLVRPQPEVRVPWVDLPKGVDREGLAVPGLRAVGGTKTPALQVFLLALLEAQTRRTPRSDGRTALPLVAPTSPDPSTGGLSWVKLVAAVAADSSDKGPYGGYQRENRLRQIKKALDRLEATGRVELGDHHYANRYERFVLTREYEDGTGRAPYTAPPPGRALPLPADLWLRGWVHVLSDAEMLLYLALRLHVAVFPDLGNGPFVLGRQARDVYGISKENYESLRELEMFGLIRLTVDEDRSRIDGTMRDFRVVGRGKFHRITLTDEGLSSDAGAAVLNGLRSLLDLLG
jgi:hypothetical protein